MLPIVILFVFCTELLALTGYAACTVASRKWCGATTSYNSIGFRWVMAVP